MPDVSTEFTEKPRLLSEELSWLLCGVAAPLRGRPWIFKVETLGKNKLPIGGGRSTVGVDRHQVLKRNGHRPSERCSVDKHIYQLNQNKKFIKQRYYMS